MTYYCSACGKETEPRLYEPGAGASCCEEAPLLVLDLWEECPEGGFRIKRYRPLTEREERELAEQLYTEEHADDTPAKRRRARWLEDS